MIGPHHPLSHDTAFETSGECFGLRGEAGGGGYRWRDLSNSLHVGPFSIILHFNARKDILPQKIEKTRTILIQTGTTLCFLLSSIRHLSFPT